MKLLFPIYIIMAFAYSLPTLAAYPCSCAPIPSSKTYQGEARKKHLIGYSIHWTCTYTCTIDDHTPAGTTSQVKASYREYYLRPENGTEGICEGMVYKAHYHPVRNDYIYMYMGETFDFTPVESSSEELRSWAQVNNCN